MVGDTEEEEEEQGVIETLKLQKLLEEIHQQKLHIRSILEQSLRSPLELEVQLQILPLVIRGEVHLLLHLVKLQLPHMEEEVEEIMKLLHHLELMAQELGLAIMELVIHQVRMGQQDKVLMEGML